MSLRLSKSGGGRARAAHHPDRPPIWADGQQRSRFDAAAFVRASHRRALDLAVSLTDRLSGRLSERLGSGVIQLARRRLQGDTGPDASDLTAVLAPSFGQAELPPPRPRSLAPEAGDEAISALRNMLRAESHSAARARRQALPELAPPLPREPGFATVARAAIVAGVSYASLLPVGLVSALLAHLAGQDLSPLP